MHEPSGRPPSSGHVPSHGQASSHGTPAGGHAPPTFTPPTDVHLLDRLAILYRYRRIAFAAFVLSSAAMMIQGYSTLKLYKADAQIMIEDERAVAVPGLNNTENTYYEDPEPYYNTQYRILRGRDLTRRVITKLTLASVPEFNGTATPPSTPATIVRDLQKRTLSAFRSSSPEPAEAPRLDETPDDTAPDS